MKNLLDDIQSTLLLGPGPSSVAPSTYHALARPTLGHLDPYFFEIMDGIKAGLQTLFGTDNELTVPLSGTGSIGMECAFVNLVEPGDKVLVLVNGVFGGRMAEVATRLGADVTKLEFPWGTPVVPAQVAAQLDFGPYKIVAIVHAETSTGVLNPVAEVAQLVRPTGALYLVDTVTSLGGVPVLVDDWGADVTYSGTQKCLSCPPGLSPITFSPRAVEAIAGRRAKVANWYLDMTLLTQYWGSGASRVYHHTAPINMLYGLYQAISNVLAEGLAASHARHRAVHERLVAGLDAIGWSLLVEEPYRLPPLNAVVVPEGVDEAALRRRLLHDHHIEVGAGLGPLAGKILRVGLMGYSAQPENVDRLLAALQ